MLNAIRQGDTSAVRTVRSIAGKGSYQPEPAYQVWRSVNEDSVLRIKQEIILLKIRIQPCRGRPLIFTPRLYLSVLLFLAEGDRQVSPEGSARGLFLLCGKSGVIRQLEKPLQENP